MYFLRRRMFNDQNAKGLVQILKVVKISQRQSRNFFGTKLTITETEGKNTILFHKHFDENKVYRPPPGQTHLKRRFL